MNGLKKISKVLRRAALAGVCIFFVCEIGQAETFCVGDAIELQNALAAAESNGADNTIHVQQGTYYGNFIYSSLDGNGIALLGGYTPGCADRVVDPLNTVLDGVGTGSALYLYHINGGDISVDGFTLQGGNTSGNGGGIYAVSSSAAGLAGDVTLTRNVIRENAARFGGGGVSALSLSHAGRAGNVTLTNSTITGNTGYPGLGGGIYAYSLGGTESGNVNLGRNTIQGNAVEGDGGGVFAVSSARARSGNVIFTNNTISGNAAGSACSGGGISAYTSSLSGVAGDVIFSGNVISENTAQTGGGLQAYSSGATQSGNVTLTNNTVTGNTADFGGGVYLLVEGSRTSVYNNIIWGNQAFIAGGDIGLERSGLSGTARGYNNDYSDMDGSWTDAGNNLNQDPLLVDLANGDVHLQLYSPCIDAGENNAPGLPNVDFEGHRRLVDGDNDGAATVDIGADEFVSPTDVLTGDN